MAVIYALIDPRTNEIRYIGQSKHHETRYKQHVHGKDKQNIDKQRWIDELKDADLVPIYSVIEDDVEWSLRFKREKYWINHCLARGDRLTNQFERKSSYARSMDALLYEREKFLKSLEDL